MTATAALRRCGFLAVGLLAAGLSTGRADLVVLATPFLIALAVAAGARFGDGRRAIDLRVTKPEVLERDTTEALVRVTCDVDLDAVQVRLGSRGFASLSTSTIVTAIEAGRPKVLRMRLRSDRWGRWQSGRAH